MGGIAVEIDAVLVGGSAEGGVGTNEGGGGNEIEDGIIVEIDVGSAVDTAFVSRDGDLLQGASSGKQQGFDSGFDASRHRVFRKFDISANHTRSKVS